MQYYFSGQAGVKSPMLAERRARYRPQMAQVKPGNDVVQPKVRKAFPDTAFWAPSVHTDAEGHARVSLTFPDSLTTWRATVRAVTSGRPSIRLGWLAAVSPVAQLPVARTVMPWALAWRKSA